MRFSKLLDSSIFSIIFLICCFNVSGQEQLKPLGGNINLPIIKAKSNLSAKTTTVTSLDLPFFDDFSYATKSPYPTANLWQDSNVYVNTGFPIAPLSIGVATFDGLNKNGYPYNILAPVSTSSQADYLTSNPINLKRMGVAPYTPDDSLYLSFYYQAEGNGDNPEPNDSLSLDFYKANQQKWQKVWGVKGYNPSATDTNFYRVMIYIKDTAYLDSSFQFRFRNRATLSGSLDHWHVDYVYLNKARTREDTSRQDVAFAYRSSSFLKNYWVMPYRQYHPSEMANKLKNYIRSNGTSTVQLTYQYDVYDSGNNLLVHYSGGPKNIGPFQSNGYHDSIQHSNPTFTFVPSFPILNPTHYTIKHYLTTTPDVVQQNDTLEQVQNFSDYFAHDDGTAEVGYYLNTYGAKTAVRFKLNVADTLRAVNIYFDPIVDGQAIQASTFRIMVWDGNGGSPGGVIYKDSLRNPTYLQGSYNMIPTYSLTSCLTLGAGTYFIGIQQTTNKALNIGFDKNTNHANDLFYNISGSWVQSAIPGSIMINPILGCTLPTPTVSVKEYEKNNLFILYPNPAQNILNIQSADITLENTSIAIISSIGQTVLSSELENNTSVDISSLPNGIYFVYFNNKQVNVSPKKLIISR